LNNAYEICVTDISAELVFEITHSDKSPLVDSETALFEIDARSLNNSKRYKLLYDNNKSYFTCVVDLDSTLFEEQFLIDAKVPGYYEYSGKINIRKRNCLRVKVDDQYQKISYSLPYSDTILNWTLPDPIVRNARSGEVLTQESQFIPIPDMLPDNYSLQRTDSGFILSRPFTVNCLTGNCFGAPKNRKIKLTLSHELAENDANYTIDIEIADNSMFSRCARFALNLMLIALFLVYLKALLTKHRFKKGKKGQWASVLYFDGYLEDEYLQQKISLRTSLLNRYLNPFGPEKKKVYGMVFTATRSTRIILSGSSLAGNTFKGEEEIEFLRDEKTRKIEDWHMSPNNVITKVISNNKRVYYKYILK